MAEKLLTRAELAQRLGVHRQTIVNWEKAGLVPEVRGRRGVSSKYKLSKVNRWRDEQDRAVRQELGDSSPAAERAKRDRAQRKLLEQTFEVRARRLLPADEVRKVWGAHIAAVRSKILALPAMAAARVHRAGKLGGQRGTSMELKSVAAELLRELAAMADDPPPTVAAPKRKRRGRQAA
ncbi:MAG: hypothetical protein OER77_08685 [Myxococcales bacterium]|nr:hypothetical protein [Myxococcales bacterium]